MKIFKGKGWDWLYAPIMNEKDAVSILNTISKGWYSIALLIAIVWLIFYYFGPRKPYFLFDFTICIFAGYFLPKFKSRTFAIILFIYSLFILILTSSSFLGLYKGTGGRNIILALMVVAMAFRCLDATFTFHKHINSKTLWKNVFLIWCFILTLSIISLIVFFLLINFINEKYKYYMSDDDISFWMGMGTLIVLGITFLILPKRFKLTTRMPRMKKDYYEVQESVKIPTYTDKKMKEIFESGKCPQCNEVIDKNLTKCFSCDFDFYDNKLI